ncbi:MULTISPECIES: hypothetical protein [unclassified Nonomuraea]|uniref:hypothetical protein n=1 Tax=unclassified Nonomuraea TaxID=2593643 RepID=UPI0033F7C83F
MTTPARSHKRELLQDIVTALVLTPVRWAKGRGYLRHFRGDIGIDTTATPVELSAIAMHASVAERMADCGAAVFALVAQIGPNVCD